MGETFYCDNYEEITGLERDGSTPTDDGVISTGAAEAKVVKSPGTPVVESSDVQVETK